MNNKNDGWKAEAIEMAEEGSMSWRAIARELGVSKSTCSDFLRGHFKGYVKPSDVSHTLTIDVLPNHSSKDWNISVGESILEVDNTAFNPRKDVYIIETAKTVKPNVTHLMIPDTQCKDGISLGYLEWLGQYIVDKQPEVIVHIGDHADMESLSSYDKGKKSAEGKRVHKDIEASIEGMNALLKPLYNLQQSQRKEFGKVLYKPKMVLTLGNHEQRIMRHVDANPELAEFLSYDNLRYKDFGWEVYDFLKPVIINGVSYVHFMANPMTGKPYGGTALNILKNVGESFCMGHKQCLDVATRFLPSSGKQQWGIIAGAYYEHEEVYKGHQGNYHSRGIVVQHNVKDGSFNPMFIDLEYLKERYNK